jgi:hypothetical protein
MNPLHLLIDLAVLALLAAAWLYFLRETVRRAAHLPSRKSRMTPELWVALALTAAAVGYAAYVVARRGRF